VSLKDAHQPLSDVGEFQDRLLDVLHDLCLPAAGVTFKPIVVDGGHCLIVEVAESLAPVMIRREDHNGYYHRVHCKSWPMNERQVRERYERLFVRHATVDAAIEEARPAGRPTDLIQEGATRPAWLTILTVPAFGPQDLFNPATFKVASFGALLRNDREVGFVDLLPSPRPSYFGLEARFAGGLGGREILLRLHRSGIIEYHHTPVDLFHPDQAVLPASRGATVRMTVHGVVEGYAVLEFLELAEALYRKAGFVSDIHIRGLYEGFDEWWTCGQAPLRFPFLGPPRAHIVDSSVERLSEDRLSFAHGLLDRVWQAAGLEICHAPFDQKP
jgi:hypothetical protein